MSKRNLEYNSRIMENFVYKPLRVLAILSAPLLADCAYIERAEDRSLRERDIATSESMADALKINSAGAVETARLNAEAARTTSAAEIARVGFERQVYEDGQAVVRKEQEAVAARQASFDDLKRVPLVGTDPIEPIRYPTRDDDGFPWLPVAGILGLLALGGALAAYGYRTVRGGQVAAGTATAD
ncbi:MAG TPA: hypothetical protein VJA47_02095 [archaeon]|nr:hypothetical protein [archaeon]